MPTLFFESMTVFSVLSILASYAPALQLGLSNPDIKPQNPGNESQNLDIETQNPEIETKTPEIESHLYLPYSLRKCKQC